MTIVYHQEPPNLLDVSTWSSTDDYEGVFPKGAREKSSLLSPEKVAGFLLPEYRYLFKESFARHPEQCWMEVLAYKLGGVMGVPVPPTFIAIKEGTIGALIEWFYDDINDALFYNYYDGGDILKRVISDFDRKTGKQHNLTTIKNFIEALKSARLKAQATFELDWKEHWAKVFTFDTILGNTDRHQDNWGLSFYAGNKNEVFIKFSPAFDNGTSMGYEILERDFYKFENVSKLENYINRGTHHMKWKLEDESRLNHIDFIEIFIEKFPDSYDIVASCAKFDMNKLEEQFMELLDFDCPIPLTRGRVEFTLKLIRERQKRLLLRLGL